MTPSSVASIFFFCLHLIFLLPAQHGASTYGSYKLGSRQIFFKSSGNSQQASTVPTATNCSSITTGGGNTKKLLVVHRRSPCSPLNGLPSLTVADVLRRDASHIRRRFSTQSSLVAARIPSSAPTIIDTNSSRESSLPGALDYSVLVSYGTPEQQLPLLLVMSKIGVSRLRCKPCALGSDDCDPAFDTSRSSTFAPILCGSPDCPINCSGSPHDGMCSVKYGTYAEDELTLLPSMAIHDFKFICIDVDKPGKLPVAGTLDISRGNNSLLSRLWSSGQVPSAAFSYCLPHFPRSQGFLSLGVDATAKENNVAVHAPLVSSGNPETASMYFIDLVGISLGDEDLPIPAGSFGNNGTSLDVGVTFTTLAPDAYMPLRDSFRRQMSQYNNMSSSPGFKFHGFDTCFNFTRLDELIIPNVQFKFGNGESLLIDGHQMLYYDDTAAGPFTVACLAFYAMEASGDFSSFIGRYTLSSMEVVYDVAGGKVGFIPWSC